MVTAAAAAASTKTVLARMAVSSRHPGGPLGAVYGNAMAEAKGIARLVQKQAGRAKEKVGYL